MVHSGPIFKSVEFVEGKALVSFDHTGSGLYCKDKEAKYFELAGSDGKYYPAHAKITGNQVLVDKKVPRPKVRFAWKNYVKVNLFNKEDYQLHHLGAINKNKPFNKHLYKILLKT